MSPLIITAPFPPAAFSPSSVSGLVLWLDAQDVSTLFQDTGGSTPVASDDDPVARWNDKSSSGLVYVTNGAGSTRPTYKTSAGINANPSLRFDAASTQGIGCTTDAGLHNAQTIFCVFELQTTPGASTAYTLWRTQDVSNDFQEMLAVNIGGYQPYSFKGDHFLPAASVGVADTLNTNPHYIRYTYNDGDPTLTTSYTFALDGTLKTIVTSGSFGATISDRASVGSRIGVGQVPSGNYSNAYIGELIVYNSVLSASDVANVELYLSSKWNI